MRAWCYGEPNIISLISDYPTQHTHQHTLSYTTTTSPLEKTCLPDFLLLDWFERGEYEEGLNESNGFEREQQICLDGLLAYMAGLGCGEVVVVGCGLVVFVSVTWQ